MIGMEKYLKILSSLKHNKNSTKITRFCIVLLIFFLLFVSAYADVVSDLNKKASNLNKEGNYKEALKVYDEALKIDNISTSSLFGKAETYNKMKQFDNAISTYEKIISIEPKNFWAWSGKGNSLKNLERYDEAISAFENMTIINSSHVSGYQSKGGVLQKLKKYDEAIEEYDKAIKADPKNIWSYSSKAGVYNEMKRYLDAISMFDKMIEINQSYYPAYTSKGDALRSLKLDKNALDVYDEAIKINPDYISTWLSKAAALSTLKRYSEALAAYDEAAKINESHPSPWSGKASVYNQIKDYEKAAEAYDKALVNDPNQTWLWTAKGNTLVNLEQYSKAVQSFDKAISLNQSDANPWVAKGKALNQAGNYTEALDALNKAIILNPNSTDAIKNRDNLLKLFDSCKSICVPEKCPDHPVNVTEEVIPSEKPGLLDSIFTFIFGVKTDQNIQLKEARINNELVMHAIKDIIRSDNSLIITDKTAGKVLVTDLNGKVNFELLPNSTGSDPITEFTDITIDNNGTIFILDAISNKIHIFDPTGTFVRSWELDKNEEGRVEQPQSISVIPGPTSIIVIADAGKATLPVYDTEGKYLEDIEIESISESGQLSQLDLQKRSVLLTQYQNIIPDQNPNPSQAERNFEIKNANDIYPINFILERGDYLGAQKNTVVDRNINDENPEDWLSVIRGMIQDPVFEKSVQQTFEKLDNIRREKSLTDSEFFDLITGFIQQLPLDKENDVRYPIEVLHDKKPGSFDKAIFLYSLLYKAGYDVIFLSYPGTNHYAVGIKTDHGADPSVVTFYNKDDTIYFYINPETASFVGRISPSAESSDPFMIHLLPEDKEHAKILPESKIRLNIIETLYQVNQKKEFLEQKIKTLVKTVQRNPQRDLDKIKTVTQFAESQPWNTEGVYLRLKNSKVGDISLNYGIK